MKVVYFLSVLFFLPVVSVDIEQSEIVPGNLLELSKRVNNAELERVGRDIIVGLSGSNPDIVRLMFGMPEKLSTSRAYRLENYKLLEESGYPSKSQHSYVVCKYGACLKISGQGSRLMGLLREHDFSHPEVSYDDSYFKRANTGKLAAEEVDDLDVKNVLTYQTSSRIAVALLVRQLALKHVSVPDQALILNDSDNKSVDDSNAIVVERIVDGKMLEEYLKEEDISDAAISELCSVIFKAGVWDLKHNTVVDGSGKIYIVDSEQPNKTPPSSAFFKRDTDAQRKDLEWTMCSGFARLIEILSEAGKSINTIADFIEAHPEIRNYHGYSTIKEYFENKDDKLAVVI